MSHDRGASRLREPWSTAPGLLLSVDPGATYCGCAAWVDGVLVGVERVVGSGRARGRGVDPAALARKVWAWWVETVRDPLLQHPEAYLVVEDQQDYPGRGARTADLDRLRAVVRHLAIVPPHRELRPRPGAWKAGVPKAVHHRRALAALWPTERRTISEAGRLDDGDVLDAVALGLWAVGRLGRGGVRVGSGPGPAE